MADNNHGNREALAQVTDDDPFAELTRIMGQTPPVEAESGEEPADPFALDLEKELMGDADLDEQAPQEAEPYAAPAASFGEDSFAAESEDAPEHEAEPAEYEAEAGDYAEPRPLQEPEAGYPAEPANFAPDDDNAEDPAFEASGHDASADNWETTDDYQPELAAAEQGYWSASASHDAGGDIAGDDGRWTSAAAEPLRDEDALADVDMDFGDLDEAAGPVDGAAMADAAGSAVTGEPPRDVSLEDELEMLLGGEQAAPDMADAGYGHDDSAASEGFPEPAQPPQSTIFTRANFNGTGEMNAADDDSSDDTESRWDDHAVDAGEVVDDGGEVVDDGADDHVGDADPLAALAALAPDELAKPVTAPPTAAPDFETVEVPETAVAQQDDLDLPDLPDEEVRHPAGPMDDFEAEFAYDFPTPTPTPTDANGHMAASDPEHTPATDDEDRFYAEALGFGAVASAGTVLGQTAGNGGSGMDGEREEDIARPDNFAVPPPLHDQPRRRTGFIVAGAVLAIAILGGIGAFALSFGGGGDSDTPVLVKADDEPLKVKPENPGGGADVPNQDSVAYEAAAGGGEDIAPQQESLVSTTEEPVNIASRTVESDRLPGVDDEALPEEPAMSGKSEDRLDATGGDAAAEVSEDVIAVQPRKVRTMIVKPDGTLVPREETASATLPAPTEASAMTPPAGDPAPAEMETMAAADPEPQPAAVDSTVASEPAVAAEPETAPTASPTETAAKSVDPVVPNTGPVVPSRPAAKPSSQPRQQVAQAAPAARTQPAAPATAATAGSEWSMQIASQPTAESAQETYQNLARRYGSILDGRGVNIIRADIAGKGTYYRVRIPTSSRSDGVSLCERYKAAGGSCFVSK